MKISKFEMVVAYVVCIIAAIESGYVRGGWNAWAGCAFAVLFCFNAYRAIRYGGES